MIARNVCLAITLVVAALVATTGAVYSAEWRVEQDGSGDFTTLQPAVDAAASGDTVLIGPGWYQELNWVDHLGNPIEVAAYWTDDKDLTFIGSSAEEVKIGPSTYLPFRDGPQGIFHETLIKGSLVVSGISLVNLYIGVNGSGSIDVSNCKFEVGEMGVSAVQGDSCRVVASIFEGGNNSCGFFWCDFAEVVQCTLGAAVYFGDTQNGVVRDCYANGRSLAYYFQSSGAVEDNTAYCTLDPVISISNASGVIIRGNQLRGGSFGVSIGGLNSYADLSNNLIEAPEHAVIRIGGGSATLTATNNDFIKKYGSDKYLVWCQSYPGDGDPVRIPMENNYWADDGLGGYDEAWKISNSIIDYNDDSNQKIIIDFEPFSTESVPTEQAPLGSVKSMFR